MHNLLSDSLIRYREPGPIHKEASLPEVYEALMADKVEAFPALRPHQRHAWHAFLVQLGTMAMSQAGLTEPPADASKWHRAIQALTERDHPDDAPWQLVLEDITKPAFMQPPARSPDRDQDFKSFVPTPDNLDMLMTSKNHDLKAAVASQAHTDDWIFALVTLQTMEGFGGAGNYGISRMNGGMGNRPAFTLAPYGRGPGAHVRRDIVALLEFLPAILAEHPGTQDGHALLWALPWDGSQTEALLLNQLNPLYIEICRRVRLKSGATSDIAAVRTSSQYARVEAKALRGLTGDPWAIVDRRDNKSDKVLTMPAGGFNYKRVVDYLTSPEYNLPSLSRPTQLELTSHNTMQLIARAMVRGQGKTEGYHERTVPIGHRLKSAMQRRNHNSLDDISAIARDRLDAVGKVQRILSHAIQTFMNRGDSSDTSPEQRKRAHAWLDRLDEILDATFFDDLQDEFEEQDTTRRTNIRNQWLRNDQEQNGVINHARTLLYDAEDLLPCPSISYYKAREAAEGLFEARLRGNAGIPNLFQLPVEEVQS